MTMHSESKHRTHFIKQQLARDQLHLSKDATTADVDDDAT